MKTVSLLRKLAAFYPTRLRVEGDFGGLMAGKLPSETKRLFLCLDFDDEVYAEAVKAKPDLVLTHHPFIFGSKRAVLAHDSVKKDLYERVINSGLAIYSYHTNFDAGSPGMNDALAGKLGLNEIKPLSGAPMARGGDLPQAMAVEAFAKFAKDKLGVTYGFLIPTGKKIIQNAAIIGGGGWSYWEVAEKEGYDIFISGDIPHHARRDIVLRHYNYLDLPHEIEKVFMQQMTKTLLSIDQKLTVISIDHEKLPTLI